MEHLLSELGPWASTIILAVVAKLLHKATRRIESLSATQVKADLAFEEVSAREPEYKRRYETWAAHR